MKLTDTDKQVLERGARGHQEYWEWIWMLEGRRVTRSVNKLRKAGLIDVTYFTGYAAAHPNPDAIA